MTLPERRISVIVPLTEASSRLDQVLLSILQTDLPRRQWELIVVNDGAGESASLMAARRADIVVRLPGEARGLAYARNRGVEVARGEILVFVDPDVLVHPGCLRAMAAALDSDAEVAAVVAVPDASSASAGVIAQLCELRHLKEERHASGNSSMLWMDCCAVRREEFIAAGMCDELCRDQPRIEAAELGRRLRVRGRRIVRSAAATMTPARQVSLFSALRTEWRDHGVPWDYPATVETPLPDSEEPSARLRRRLVIALPWAAMVAASVALLRGGPVPWAVAGVLMLVAAAIRAPLYWLFLRERGLRFTAAAIPLHVLLWLVAAPAHARRQLMHHTLGAPRPDPTVEAFSEVCLTVWPPLPKTRRTAPAPGGSNPPAPVALGENPAAPAALPDRPALVT